CLPAREFAQPQTFRAEPFRDPQWRQRAKFAEPPDAPPFQRFEQLQRRLQQSDRERRQELAFIAIRNDVNTRESARRENRGIGIGSQRQRGLYASFAAAPRDGGGNVLGQPEQTVEPPDVEGNGARRRHFDSG